MKIMVAVKRVLDYNVKARVKADNSGIDLENAKMSMNPFDEIAVEEALRIKEAGNADEVIIISIGGKSSQDTIRTALAMGADRGILIQSEEDIQPLGIAKLLKYIVEKELPNLLLLGKQAIDNDHNQTGQMLAALLGWSQATFASTVVVSDSSLSVTREVDGGLESIKLVLPAVITVDLRLNEPRYAKLPNIMKAKKKPLEIINFTDTGIDIASRVELLKVIEPAARSAGQIVGSTAELLDKLRNEAKIIGEVS